MNSNRELYLIWRAVGFSRTSSFMLTCTLLEWAMYCAAAGCLFGQVVAWVLAP